MGKKLLRRFFAISIVTEGVMPQPSARSPIAKINNAEPRTASMLEAKLKVRYAILFLTAICLSLVVVASWEGWSSRQYHLHDKETAMSNLAQTLASQAQASFKQADTVLFSLVNHLEIDDMGYNQLPGLQLLLKAQRNELTQLHGLSVFNEKGGVIAEANAVTPPSANNSDREYFIFHREHPDGGPHLADAITSEFCSQLCL